MVNRLPRVWIELCQDEGVCHVCGRIVEYGPNSEGVYTITGAHYSCEFPGGRSPGESLRDLVETIDAKFQDFGLQPVSEIHALARANGGHLVHWVIPKNGRAFCGHKPTQKAWRMRQRGKWLYLPDGTDVTGFRFCQSCLSKHQEQYPVEEELPGEGVHYHP